MRQPLVSIFTGYPHRRQDRRGVAPAVPWICPSVNRALYLVEPYALRTAGDRLSSGQLRFHTPRLCRRGELAQLCRHRGGLVAHLRLLLAAELPTLN